jgi:hypothetical protein
MRRAEVARKKNAMSSDAASPPTVRGGKHKESEDSEPLALIVTTLRQIIVD